VRTMMPPLTLNKYDSDADAAAFGGDERSAQGAIVPPDTRSLAQAPPRISSFCVCARVPFVYTPSVKRRHAWL